ncbi:MAG: GNAT family N-acetyltransferase [Lachnospiraceae bacterium]|nr:GNAT family N-acetyltransferase [Lachnospiraceae bacterium]
MYQIRQAIETDILSIIEIMRFSYEHLENKDWYYIEGNDNTTWLSEHLEQRGRCFVAEKNGKIVGFLIVRIPKTDDDNLGIGIYDNALMEIAHMETIAIMPKHRGNHLMQKMIMYAEEALHGMYQYYMATVHPENHASLYSFLKCGYIILKEQENKYENLPRLILVKQCKKSL